MENHQAKQKVITTQRRYKGRRKISKKTIFFLCLALVVLLLVVCFGLHYLLQTPYTGETQVHFIDVGQGDSVLIVQDGEYALIDTGTAESRDVLITYLDNLGVKKIKYLILTHYHTDHIGGASMILKNYMVENILLPNAEIGPPVTTSTALHLLEAVDELTTDGKLNAFTPETSSTYPLGNGQLTVLSNGLDSDDLNSTSLIIKFEAGSFSFLDTGDAEADVEAKLIKDVGTKALRCSLFKAGHHGSSTANTEDFLAAVHPKIIVVSCGANNDYGHPHTETLRRFQKIGATLYRTDKNGSVVICVSDGEVSVVLQKGA